jgi:hypothetical protein
VFLLSPKSCSDSWSELGDRELVLEELTCGFCSSRAAQVTPVRLVLLTGLTGVSPLWDLPQVSCGINVSLGCVGAGLFLAVLEVFSLALCWILLSCRLCF